MVMELHPGTPTQIEEATRRLTRTAASTRPLTPQMQAEVDALVFKPQRQIPTAGFDFLPRRPLYHHSTPQRKAPLDSLGRRPTERVGLRSQRACLLLSGTKLLQVRARVRANPTLTKP